MPSVGPLAYPFDPTGQASTNLVSGEQQVLTAANYKDYNFVVPNFAPFFGASVVVTITDAQGVTRTLQQGLDYFPVMQYIGASRACARPIYGAISFVNLSLVGTVTLQYQTIGGNWTLDQATLAAIAADTIYNPYTVTWEQIAQVPTVFPVIDHEWDLTDMVGMSDVVAAINSLSTIVLQSSQTGISDHISNTHNPHLVSKDQVGLSNVLNFPPATVQDALSGLSAEMYITPLALKAVLANFVAKIAVPAAITDHVASKLNPHVVTKDQVGLGQVVDLPLVTSADIIAGKPVAKYLTLEMLYNFIAHNGGLNVTGASASVSLTATASSLTVGTSTNITLQFSGLNPTSTYTATLLGTNPGGTSTNGWTSGSSVVTRTFTTDSTGSYATTVSVLNDGSMTAGYWKFGASIIDSSSVGVTLTQTPASINFVISPAITLSASLLTVGANQSSVLTAAALDMPAGTTQHVVYYGTYTQTGQTYTLYNDTITIDSTGKGTDANTVSAAPQGLPGAWTIYASINGVKSNTISQTYATSAANPVAVITAATPSVAVGATDQITISVTGFGGLAAYTGNVTASLNGTSFSLGSVSFNTDSTGAATATLTLTNDGTHTAGTYTIGASFSSVTTGYVATVTTASVTLAATTTNPAAVFTANPSTSPVGGSVTFTGRMTGFLPNSTYVAYWTIGGGTSNTATTAWLNSSSQQITSSFTTDSTGAATISNVGANGTGTYTILGGTYNFGATFKTSAGVAVTVATTVGSWTATPSSSSLTLAASSLSLSTNTSLTYTTTASGFAPNTTFTAQWYSQWTGDSPAYSVTRNFTSVTFTTNSNGTASVTTTSAGLPDSLAGTYKIYATLNGTTSNTLTQTFVASTAANPSISISLNPTTVGSGASALATYSITGLTANATYILTPNYSAYTGAVFGGTTPTVTNFSAQSFTASGTGSASITVNTPTSLAAGTWTFAGNLATSSGTALSPTVTSANLTVSGSSSSSAGSFTASPASSGVGGSVTFTGTFTGLTPNTTYNANFLVGVSGGALGIYYSAIGSTTQMTRSFTTNSSGTGTVSLVGGNNGLLGNATYQVSARIVNASTGVDSGITPTPCNWTTVTNPSVGFSASTYNLPTNTSEQFYATLTDFPVNTTFTITTYSYWSGDTPAYSIRHLVESFDVTTNANGQASITRYSSGLPDTLAGTYQIYATCNGINSASITQTYTVGGTSSSSSSGSGGFSIG
jgi:hypothetical protein